MSTDGSDDEDYDAYMEAHHGHLDAKRFPIHDACEFDSLEALKVRSSVGDFFTSVCGGAGYTRKPDRR